MPWRVFSTKLSVAPPCTQILFKVGCSHWSSLACSLYKNPVECLPLLQLKMCMFEISIVQQCRMLESNLCTDILAQCLTDPEHAIHTLKVTRTIFLSNYKDYCHLLFSASHCQVSTVQTPCGPHYISHIVASPLALDRGVKGTHTFQSLFKELSCPISCFKCSQCGNITDSLTCFEHACTSHPNLMEDLSCKDLISALGKG